MAKFVKKGARVGIMGSLTISKWTEKESGAERNTPKVVVRQLDILESKAEAELRDRNSAKGDDSGFFEK
jgi:single-strand DNA-binding protein